MALPAIRTSQPLDVWDPWHDLTDLHQRMDRLMNSVFDSFDTNGTTAWRPFADLRETDDEFVLEVDLPGVKREDISIELVGNELMISGELKEREKAGWLRHRTRRTGSFRYSVGLQHEVDADHITATLTDGVLTVTVPKAETAKPRRIEIAA